MQGCVIILPGEKTVTVSHRVAFYIIFWHKRES